MKLEFGPIYELFGSASSVIPEMGRVILEQVEREVRLFLGGEKSYLEQSYRWGFVDGEGFYYNEENGSLDGYDNLDDVLRMGVGRGPLKIYALQVWPTNVICVRDEGFGTLVAGSEEGGGTAAKKWVEGGDWGEGVEEVWVSVSVPTLKVDIEDGIAKCVWGPYEVWDGEIKVKQS